MVNTDGGSTATADGAVRRRSRWLRLLLGTLLLVLGGILLRLGLGLLSRPSISITASSCAMGATRF